MFFKGLLFTMALGMMSCGDDDKKDEIVDDPLQTETEYYIVGTVSDANGAVTGAKAEVNGTNSDTDANGVYSLTLKEAGTYVVKFSANGLEAHEESVTIANGAANRTQVTLNVKLAKAIDMTKGAQEEVKEGSDTTLSVPDQETGEKDAAFISIPDGAADAGTTITAVVYEEAKATLAEEKTTSVQEMTASVNNVAVTTTPAGAVAQNDIEILIPNGAEDSYFDVERMEALKDGNVATKAATVFGDVTFKNNNYVITIPKGESIAGKYIANVKYTKKAENAKSGAYNKVNGESNVVKFENRDYNAKDVTLDVEVTCGWNYLVSPAEALKAVGASDGLVATIQKYIENDEGKEGTYTVTKNLNASISGNHVLYFGSRAKVQEKSYTFDIIVKGGKKSSVTIKLLCYIGYTEDYTNGPISQHSGGTTGGNN